ncbi:MFS transporter [Neorhizobium sp. NCHU2750]|uniref:MFS transporter n=1 Tax=Neorhizobium sp. NCHU2750 TaxID=1825976 RepID=UPI000EB746CB|nr:alpha-ketoglutarate transporter [Neorhizobium sp. NCHU2750]
MASSKTPTSKSTHPRDTVIDRIGIPRPLLWGFIGLLILMIGDGVELGYLAPYLEGKGIGSADVALLFTVYGVAVAIASWMSGALSSIYGARKVMWAGIAIWAIFQVAFLVFGLGTMNYTVMMITYGLRGFGYPLFAYSFLVWIAAATPSRKLGMAVGWFWFAYAAGLPTLGSLVASIAIPLIGTMPTLWLALALVVIGAVLGLIGLTGVKGGERLAPKGEKPMASLLSSITIMWEEPLSTIGGLVRTVNTSSQYAFFIVLPGFFMDRIGFSLSAWLQLLTLIFCGNLIGNLASGALGNRIGYRTTVIWMGAIGTAATILLLYYVPLLYPGNFLVASLVGLAYGITLGGFVPLSALMPTVIPHNKAGALSVLSLGAGASTWVGPAIVAVFLGSVGLEGIMWIFAGLYVASAILAMMIPEANPQQQQGKLAVSH